MLCAELERLEAEFDDVVGALEDPSLTQTERHSLEEAYDTIVGRIKRHREEGHAGTRCFEDE